MYVCGDKIQRFKQQQNNRFTAGLRVINTQYCYAAVHTNLYNWQQVVLIFYHLYKKMVQISTDLRYHLTTVHYCRVHNNRSSEVSLKFNLKKILD